MSAPAATSTMDLVVQAQAIEHPRPVPGVSGLWGLEYGEQSAQVSQAQLMQIRAEVMKQMRRGLNRANITVQGGIEGHLDKINLRKDQYIVSRVSDLFVLQTLPDFAIWRPAVEAMARAEAELDASKLAYVRGHRVGRGLLAGGDADLPRLSRGDDQWRRPCRDHARVDPRHRVRGRRDHRDDRHRRRGRDRHQHPRSTASGTAAQQAMEVHLDLRKEMDWRGSASTPRSA